MKLELRTLSLVLLLTLNAASLAGVAGQRRSIAWKNADDRRD